MVEVYRIEFRKLPDYSTCHSDYRNIFLFLLSGPNIVTKLFEDGRWHFPLTSFFANSLVYSMLGAQFTHCTV